MKKAAIVINSGIGNALLQVPLVKALQKQGFAIDGYFTEIADYRSLFNNLGVFDQVRLLKLPVELFNAPFRKNQYETVYLDFFASTRKLAIWAASVGKEVALRKDLSIPLGLQKKLNYLELYDSVHEVTQNMRFIQPDFSDSDVSAQDIRLKLGGQHGTAPDEPYLVVQPTTGNNKARYKDWPIEKWCELLLQLESKFPGLKIILAGDAFETENAKQIVRSGLKNCMDKTGQTSLNEVASLLSGAQLFLGGDSGLMHLSASLGTPTFTIWGASDHTMYGYEKLFPETNKIVHNKVDCWPCNRYFNSNTSRVNDPDKCPDFKCIRDIPVSQVGRELFPFLQSQVTREA